MDIEQLINIIKSRPGMFIGDLNINNLRNYISGCLFNNLICDRKYPIDIIFSEKFHDWVKRSIEKKRGIKFELDVGYADYIEAVCENGEQETALFFELCEEFFEEMRSVDNRNEDRRLLVCMAGLLDLLYEKVISIEEAESYLFSSRRIGVLRARGCNEQILDILGECCELRSIQFFNPDRLSDTICDIRDRTIQILKNYPYFGQED